MPKTKDKDDSPKHLKSKNKSSKKLKRKSSPPPNDDVMDDAEFQKVLLNLFPSQYQKDKTNKAKEALDKLKQNTKQPSIKKKNKKKKKKKIQ